jgi:hypothetical protein
MLLMLLAVLLTGESTVTRRRTRGRAIAKKNII